MLPSDEYEDRDLSIQDILLTEGRLKVTLIECTRYIFVHFCSFLTKQGPVSSVCSNYSCMPVLIHKSEFGVMIAV